MRTSTNPTGPEVNDHVNFQWPSYEQPHGSNLKPQRKQTSWSQTLTTGPPSRWFPNIFNGIVDGEMTHFPNYNSILDGDEM